MERSWWWKAALYGVAIVLAGLYLTPTIYSQLGKEDQLPGFFQKYFKKRIQTGLDLQGGLHLVYEVNIEKAVSGKVDRMANNVEDALKKKGAEATIERSGRDDIAVKFKVPGEAVVVPLGTRYIEAQLQHRNVRVGIEMEQHGP